MTRCLILQSERNLRASGEENSRDQLIGIEDDDDDAESKNEEGSMGAVDEEADEEGVVDEEADEADVKDMKAHKTDTVDSDENVNVA